MASTAQISANRQNAQFSTGPKTLEGIAACRFNATKHGCAGSQIVVKGEDPAAYEQLKASLLETFAPADENEAMLVEQIAQNYWRLQRARRMEAAVISEFGELKCATDPEASKAFGRAHRYVSSIERAYNGARRDLKQLQDARRERAAEAAAREAAELARRRQAEENRRMVERATRRMYGQFGSVSHKGHEADANATGSDEPATRTAQNQAALVDTPKFVAANPMPSRR